jgi:K+-sensing histidine kinase KdpD
VNQEANQEVDQEANHEVNHEVNHEEDLGLSACQGILQEHSGQLSRERRPDGVLLLRVELPITESAPAKPKPSTVPVLWQSRPFA